MLLEQTPKLGKLIVGMHRVSGDTPITMKMRTAVKESKMLAEGIMQKAVTEWSPSAITLHGRTKRARYSKNVGLCIILLVQS